MNIFVRRPPNSQVELDVTEVDRLLAMGELDLEDMAWKPGMTSWAQLKTFPEITLPSPPPLPGFAQGGRIPPPLPNAEKKSLASHPRAEEYLPIKQAETKTPQFSKKVIGISIMLLGLLIPLAAIVISGFLPNQSASPFPSSIPHSASANIFDETCQLIVMLESYNQLGQPLMQGSGVILGPSLAEDKKDTGLKLTTGTDVITNYHVIKNADHVILTTKTGTTHLAAIIFFDEELDIAVLRAPFNSSINETEIRSTVQLGEPVFTISNPQGLGWSLSEGIISRTPNDESNLIQFTAPVSSGSSGGGLFDSKGKLIGIVTVVLQDSQNLNFAIALSHMRKDITALRHRNGITFSAVDPNDWATGTFLTGDSERGSRPRYAKRIEIMESYYHNKQSYKTAEMSLMADPNRSAVNRFKTSFQLEEVFYSENRSLLEYWHNEYPNDPEATVETIEMLSCLGEKADALALLKEALDTYPGHFPIYEQAAGYLLKHDSSDELVDLLTTVSNEYKNISEKERTFSDAWSNAAYKIKEPYRHQHRARVIARYNSLIDVYSKAGVVSNKLKIE